MFPNLFNGLGKLEGSYHIKLRNDAKPYTLQVPRRVALPLLPIVEAELQRMEALQVISKTEEPTEWCPPMVFPYGGCAETKWDSMNMCRFNKVGRKCST